MHLRSFFFLLIFVKISYVLNFILINFMQQQHHVSCVSKTFLRKLLSVDGVDQPISRPKFCRICKQHQLHDVVGMDEMQFKATKVFCRIEAQALFAYFKFEPMEISDAV